MSAPTPSEAPDTDSVHQAERSTESVRTDAGGQSNEGFALPDDAAIQEWAREQREKSTALAYYNECNSFAADWLRNLIAGGHIAPGDVDERSIEDVSPDDLAGYAQCHFFAGIGGWSYALRLAGWPDSTAVWTGSCPCQPFSGLGGRRGTEDERHLWPTWFGLIAQRRPAVVFGEQVAGGDGPAWLAGVRAEMEAAGYAFGAADLPAGGVSAPQERRRLWFVSVGDPEGKRWGESVGAIYSETARRQASRQPSWSSPRVVGHDGIRRRAPPGVFQMAHGVPDRMEQLRGFGNAIVPQVAAQWIAAFMHTACADA